ncbi:hypothetical protein [Streptomyces sp. NPDC047706]
MAAGLANLAGTRYVGAVQLVPTVRHACPIPQGARLPFTARGPVFRMR